MSLKFSILEVSKKRQSCLVLDYSTTSKISQIKGLFMKFYTNIRTKRVTTNFLLKSNSSVIGVNTSIYDN